MSVEDEEERAESNFEFMSPRDRNKRSNIDGYGNFANTGLLLGKKTKRMSSGFPRLSFS